MADLIAVLMAALVQLLAVGAADDALGSSVAELIMKSQPVPIAEVTAGAEEISAGGIGVLSLGLTDLLLDPLEIDRADINIHGVSVDENNMVQLEEITFVAKISQADLTDALRLHTESLTDASISISNQQLELSGTYPLWRMRIPYRVSGSVSVINQTQLVFNVDRSGLGAVNSPAALNRLIEQEINPVYDLADFAARSDKDIKLAREQLDYGFMLEIQEIELKQGHIIVKGKA